MDQVRDLLEGGTSIAADDKFAQLTRALWSQGVLVDVQEGVRLAKPIVIRWAVGGAALTFWTRRRYYIEPKLRDKKRTVAEAT